MTYRNAIRSIVTGLAMFVGMEYVVPAVSMAQKSPIVFAVAPANLRQCDAPKVVLVEWDVPANAGIKEIRIVTVDGSKEMLFTDAGLRGKLATGPWAKAGSVFIMRDRANNGELAKIVIGSTPC
jgi:hypothetical protein